MVLQTIGTTGREVESTRDEVGRLETVTEDTVLPATHAEYDPNG